MKDQKHADGEKTDAPANNIGAITRRTAIVGGMSSLLAGVLTAKKAVAQTSAQPLMLLGGLCEGHIVKFNTADSIAWVQSMLAKSAEFKALYDYFTAQGMSFILSRAKVYLHSATTVAAGAKPSTIPGIVGIIPSFVQINRTDPFHDAVGLLVDAAGFAYAGGVRVSHNPFSIQQFTVYDIVPKTPLAVVAHSISATDLQRLSADEAAKLLGNPPITAGRFDANSAMLPAPDRPALLAMTYKAIMNDSYARPLYPVDGFNALIGQTPLVQKFGDATFQRYANTLGMPMGIPLCCSCNGCTCCITITIGKA